MSSVAVVTDLLALRCQHCQNPFVPLHTHLVDGRQVKLCSSKTAPVHVAFRPDGQLVFSHVSCVHRQKARETKQLFDKLKFTRGVDRSQATEAHRDPQVAALLENKSVEKVTLGATYRVGATYFPVVLVTRPDFRLPTKYARGFTLYTAITRITLRVNRAQWSTESGLLDSALDTICQETRQALSGLHTASLAFVTYPDSLEMLTLDESSGDEAELHLRVCAFHQAPRADTMIAEADTQPFWNWYENSVVVARQRIRSNVADRMHRAFGTGTTGLLRFSAVKSVHCTARSTKLHPRCRAHQMHETQHSHIVVDGIRVSDGVPVLVVPEAQGKRASTFALLQMRSGSELVLKRPEMLLPPAVYTKAEMEALQETLQSLSQGRSPTALYKRVLYKRIDYLD